MFWGMNLKPNRKYSQTTIKSFHVSQAALDPEGADDTVNKIFITGEDNQKYLICTLRKNVCEQVMLDLNFAEGDTICFQTIGSGNVSLSGYLTNLDFEGEELGEEEGMSFAENELSVLNGKAGKKKGQKKQGKKAEDDSEDNDEDDDAILNAALESDDDEEGEDEEMEDGNEEESDDDSDEDEEDDDDDEEDEEEVEEPKKKVAKVEKKDNKKQQQQQQQNGVKKSKKEKKAEQQQKKSPQQHQQQQQQQQQKSGGERTLSGGVKVEDIRIGNGEEAKSGKRAQVYYEGRLKSNNKVFDSLKNGAPFKFTIGRGEVIKSWDVGVVGMKVGGKRRIICPPHMAYGARGSPPTIPPNSTLVFEVELKNVSK